MPKTDNRIYKALDHGNTKRLKALLTQSGLSNEGFCLIRKGYVKDLREAITTASLLKIPRDDSTVPRKSDFDMFFDYLVGAVDKGRFLKQIRDTAAVKEASENQKLPKDIRTILCEPESVNRLSGPIEGLSDKQLASLIMHISPSEGISPADINYELFRTIIKAIRNTELVPLGQLCQIMADNLRIR
jgi:hypothetical protein